MHNWLRAKLCKPKAESPPRFREGRELSNVKRHGSNGPPPCPKPPPPANPPRKLAHTAALLTSDNYRAGWNAALEHVAPILAEYMDRNDGSTFGVDHELLSYKV